ncbi:S8/S53 family peptidase [Myroides guanonis]|uniref:Por secretion system C-terminal sorting domain-containing protein n=1 Tax=Myroides guanonis TaxID=1150112 RepID=A0A1I3R7F0_9FLAO|nr:S8/S53 family peptidase [Myroides guanonis]SFJ41257.1 Por secretion system C-terminal sorting domain-containing protein [Myroides guanonis]
MTIQKKIMFPFIFGICASMFAQDANVRQKITRNYDLANTNSLVEKLTLSANSSKELALKIAKEKNLPISGISNEGRFFELQGVFPNGDLKYFTTYNAGSRATARVNSISTGGEFKLNLNGENMIIGILEGTVALETHQEFTDDNGVTRVKKGENFPPLQNFPQNQLENYLFQKAHATHTTGTLIAKGLNPKAKGIAPKASVNMFNWNGDVAKMTTQASKGLLVSNHSYGINIVVPDGKGGYVLVVAPGNFGLYEEEAIAYDKLIYNHKYYQPVMAAGNDRGWAKAANPSKKGNDMLLGKTVAKNTVVVAAVEEVLNYTSASDVIMSDFSNFGPADDFRIKPDISAKGVKVLSALYEFPKPPNSIYSEPLNNLYVENEGTSMAAPVVTGVFALWQQWAIENSKDGVPFKSATLRAMMAHTADEAGNTPGPDHMFGWGLLNAQRGVEVMLNSKIEGASVIEENILNNNAKYDKTISVNGEVSKINVTIAWTDPAGTFHMSNFESENNVIPAIVNDLDVVVTKAGEEFLPWKLKKDFNDLRAIKENNDVDNIEKIEIDNVTAGEYTVSVSHKGSLTFDMQEYSLIVSLIKEDGTLLSTDNNQLTTVDTFKIWPNPVNEVLNITIPESNGFEKVSYAIYDITGKLLSRGHEQNNTSIEVPVSELSKGVYFIEIQSNGLKSSTQKFIKN